jgi:hypothetical protein
MLGPERRRETAQLAIRVQMRKYGAIELGIIKWLVESGGYSIESARKVLRDSEAGGIKV